MEEQEIILHDDDFKSERTKAREYEEATDEACLRVSKARSPILNAVSALMGDADLPIVNKARLYSELNELASVVAKAKRILRGDLEEGGDEDYDIGHQICEVRIVHSMTLDSAAWKKDDPRGYDMVKMDYLKPSKRMSVKFRNKKGV